MKIWSPISRTADLWAEESQQANSVPSSAVLCYPGSADSQYPGKGKGKGRGLIKVLSPDLHGGTEENRNNSVRISVIPTEIRSKHLPKISLQRYRYMLLACLQFLTHPKMERRGGGMRGRLEPGADAALRSQSQHCALSGRLLDSGLLQHQVPGSRTRTQTWRTMRRRRRSRPTSTASAPRCASALRRRPKPRRPRKVL
ncbi:uncharacterized protein LOC111863748 isoform X9 [Cryptotermes secundus]|uniref:uncharacterized protein LOC111863748 isoform X9 n=1 Tax=Cryptotermes secundus TaxID=105785 RepID=UPI001454DCE4|nr:uncharacterized protein LOC111863748 isoform X9 [Cryptotermes secundus]